MKQNQLFKQTRWQLVTWYTGILGLILALCGLGVYEAVAHAHRITIEQELQSVARTLHDSLETVLREPGKLEPEAIRLLPDACLTEGCLRNTDSHEIEAIAHNKYYLRLFQKSGNLVAVAGLQPEGLPRIRGERQLVTLADAQGTRYRQISLMLHTRDNRDWGYLQVGRNLQDFDRYVANVKWILLLGLPVVAVLVMAAGWGLAGRAMQPIYQSYRQMQQFTADAAHELRTPLAAMRATVESMLMLPRISEVDVRETLQVIDRQNQRLTHLVADLLILCRIDRQLNQNLDSFIEEEEIVLNDLVNDIGEELAVLALDSGIELSFEILVTQPLKVKGNTEQLYCLLFNLASNGIQYTPAGGKVTLILKEEKDRALIQVKDTGIGIPPEEQETIFDRFYRVDQARSRHRGGSGLGLAIARAIARAHHGSISVQSQVGQGSTFAIRLPKASSSG
ncbi:MAG: two-component system sensor histidine kinase RppB [Cyanobacteriota bacterium]|nr:two-component system sensor histidine kinase RppB [Cyanobacteriota bacterium]